MELKAYAKLNLYLDITGALPGGYHELAMIMQTVDLCDTVTIRGAENIRAHAAGVSDGDNIAAKAASCFFSRTGISGGADIEIEKRIPGEAGMGGGSADAAAVLSALNDAHGHPLSREELLSLGAKLGADVPFALFGGTALARGIGERLERIENRMRAFYVIIKPPEGVSTAAAFSLYDALSKEQGGDIAACARAIEAGDIFAYAALAKNTLFPSASALCPSIAQALAFLNAQPGCACSLMTGSGSASFGVFAQKEEAQAALFAAKRELAGWFAAMATDVTRVGTEH